VKSPLPIDPHLPQIVETIRRARAAVIVAAPGAGKTTRIPPALVGEGPVILLQPRRIAARMLARRIAEENGWRLGEEIGWQVRFERRFSARTRLLVATEGILTARLTEDPLLSGFRTIILDEFHERSIHADLALALAREAMRSRDDLRVVVMSATLDAAPVSEFLGGAPVIELPGRLFPIEIDYRPGATVADAVLERLPHAAGDILCFLPGAREIGEAAAAIQRAASETDAIPLHGALSPEEQDRALQPSVRRKVILATNIAETSLTVEGVREVIDSGRQKVLRYDTTIALDRLVNERVSRDSAEQRAGRAGRLAPGRATRLWDERDILRPHRQPEIERIDLAAPTLQILAWGGDPRRFGWFETPPPGRIDAAFELLELLGAIDGSRLTELGRRMLRLPLHPRLARCLAEEPGSNEVALACAILSELNLAAERPLRVETTVCDLLPLIDGSRPMPQRVRDAAAELGRIARSPGTSGNARDGNHEPLLRALLAGFPDRVARRRESKSERLLLASGHGAALARESGVRSGEFLLAIDVAGGERSGTSEALVRLASSVDPAWIRPTRREIVHEFDRATRSVRARERSWYLAIPLGEQSVAPDPAEAQRILLVELRRDELPDTLAKLVRRAGVAGVELDLDSILDQATAGRLSVDEVDPLPFVPRSARQQIDRLAPERLVVPTGRSVPLDYAEDGSVVAAVKLQELFGLAESPRIGARREAVTFSLLAPNGRPVQTTRDLRSFWERTYLEVRRELRGRYPKHSWPDDPWNAPPTRR
jgi:ATP-dependent helicase HrpB